MILPAGAWGGHAAVIDEKVEGIDFKQHADIVGITAMTPAANRAYEIADSFRQRGVKVVMGGMHVSKLPEEALQHCDAVVIGEAENLWQGHSVSPKISSIMPPRSGTISLSTISLKMQDNL